MQNITNLQHLSQIIGGAERIILVGHVNPDGDSIGSLMGMKGYLSDLGKVVTAIVPNRHPEFLNFLDPDNLILPYSESAEQVQRAVDMADLVICLDFNSLKRIDALGSVIGECNAPKVLIDHHPQPDTIFNLIYSYPHFSSTCELVYWILKGLLQESGKSISIQSAVALYTGMMTDTNNFANSVIPSTFKMAGELMELGVDKEWVQKMVFGGYSQERMRLMGYMLSENMKILPKYNAAIMILTKEIKERFNFADGDSEGFVNLALNIKGIRVSGLFTEGDEFIRVSLRSKDDFSVNRLAREFFNGGGHERAAGGRLFFPINEVGEYFEKSLDKFINGDN